MIKSRAKGTIPEMGNLDSGYRKPFPVTGNHHSRKTLISSIPFALTLIHFPVHFLLQFLVYFLLIFQQFFCYFFFATFIAIIFFCYFFCYFFLLHFSLFLCYLFLYFYYTYVFHMLLSNTNLFFEKYFINSLFSPQSNS